MPAVALTAGALTLSVVGSWTPALAAWDGAGSFVLAAWTTGDEGTAAAFGGT